MFYVGDKYKLTPQLNSLFPNNINIFHDVFAGGGSASLNAKANSFSLNDVDKNVISIHEFLIENSPKLDELILHFYELIDMYGLSHSELNLNNIIVDLKKDYPKTYFSKYNKNQYLQMRDDYNGNKDRIDLLYLLIIYGFNHMIRYNKLGNFNLPVGNVDWNKNVTKALKDYSDWVLRNNEINISNLDFESYISIQNPTEDDFFYFDPPYLITSSDYNKIWSVDNERRLYKLLDKLSDEGVSWGLSNMVYHKDRTNEILTEWSDKYHVFAITSNYISRFDNSIKNSKEIYVTNKIEE